ncbi:hypothetical protein cypCar_00031971 [Cyprinus carpio]|nr:hypothetical protein cypCar_00031971 [Cyprinus carpio]
MELSIDRDARLSVPGQTTSVSASLPLLKQTHAGGFKKVCRIEEESTCPFPGLPAGVLEMRVKEGSKIRNLMGFAMARMQDEARDASQTGLRQVVFTGSGRAVTKTITCAEIMKRKLGGLHQMTKLQYKGLREVWESQERRFGSELHTTQCLHQRAPALQRPRAAGTGTSLRRTACGRRGAEEALRRRLRLRL